jgi:hypothetical protein
MLQTPRPNVQPGITRTVLQRHDLRAPGREVIQGRVELAPLGRTWADLTGQGYHCRFLWFSSGEGSMPAQTSNLFLLEDLEDVSRTSELAEGDLAALQAIADWIKTFVVQPHKDLGRAGTVCPYVPGSLERRTLWLAPEQIADRDVSAVVELMSSYKRLLLDTQPLDGDDRIYNVIVVVFPDLSPDRAQRLFADVLEQLAIPSYAEHGILFGPYYDGNEGTAVYNSSFRPFQSPVPFLFVRHGVTSDWKFFLDTDEWLTLWARRSGASAVQALAEELRRLPWREA